MSMFVTIYGASKEVLMAMANEIKTSALIYPDGKGMFYPAENPSALEGVFVITHIRRNS